MLVLSGLENKSGGTGNFSTVPRSNTMTLPPVTEHVCRDREHSTFYLACGPTDGPLIVFVHGWPELSISWRHQLPLMGALGFRAVAPDMRGYGGSSVYPKHEDYAQRHIVADMISLLEQLEAESAVWIGHDWGSPVVWNLASHHPERCVAAASLCVPYRTLERGLDACIPLINRELYPHDEYPLGQWEYQAFYEESFDTATACLDADPYATIRALFRSGQPKPPSKAHITAVVRKDGGWFGGAAKAPDMSRDDKVLSETDLTAYGDALQRNGFFGPCSYYMNHAANADYSASAINGGFLEMPILFLAASYDYTCECLESDLAKPMSDFCKNLTTITVDSGHWMAQEKPVEVNAALIRWLTRHVTQYWPFK